MPAAAVLYPIPRGGEYIPTGGTYPDARVEYPDGMGSISREGKMGWVHRAEAAGVMGYPRRVAVHDVRSFHPGQDPPRPSRPWTASRERCSLTRTLGGWAILTLA